MRKYAAVLSMLASLSIAAHAADGASAFEKIKSLAGTWKGKAAMGADDGGPTTVVYRVTANGNTVEETIDPGTPHEMITMYYLEGKSLVMTHYCTMGNQPHMKLISGSGKKLNFDFAGGTNILPGAGHMHALTMEFVGKDQLKSAWTMMAGKKQVACATFDLRRAK